MGINVGVVDGLVDGYTVGFLLGALVGTLVGFIVGAERVYFNMIILHRISREVDHSPREGFFVGIPEG